MRVLFVNIFILLLFLVSCENKKPEPRTVNNYTMEELVVIEFATRMEELEHRYKDYHKSSK